MIRGYCRYVELIDGSLSLCDVAEMNDVIAVQDENERRAAEAFKNA